MVLWHRDSESDLGITRFHTLATQNVEKNQGKTALFSIETGLFDGLNGHLRNPWVTRHWSESARGSGRRSTVLLELPILLLMELLSAWRCFECGSVHRPWSR